MPNQKPGHIPGSGKWTMFEGQSREDKTTYSCLELGNLSLAFSGGECLGFLESDGDFSDFNLQLLAEGFGVLVVVLFLSEFLSQPVHLSLESVSALLGGSSAVKSVIKIGLHGADVSLHTALVVGEGGDLDGDLGQTDRCVVELVLGVLACTVGL